MPSTGELMSNFGLVGSNISGEEIFPCVLSTKLALSKLAWLAVATFCFCFEEALLPAYIFEKQDKQNKINKIEASVIRDFILVDSVNIAP